MRDADLRAVFDRSVRRLARGVPIRKTIAGIWTPSPVSVIVQVAALLREMGLVGAAAAPGPVVDAGTGDGRVAAVLSRLEPSRPVYGIEKDPALCVQAAANLRALRARGKVHLVEGDYCDVAAYESCGLDRRAIAVVVNYPDGNQRRLARFVAEHAGPDARLCLFTHDPVGGGGRTRAASAARRAGGRRARLAALGLCGPWRRPAGRRER